MAIRKVPFATGEYYHLYNRGNSKQIIFHDDQDHYYFINLLLVLNNSKQFKSRYSPQSDVEEKLVSIGSYCLMPNHFHVLIRQEKDGGISLFMQKLLTGYAMYYNKKYKHTGGLFEGRFKSKYAGEDRYMKYLFSYIHLNPLKIIDKDWKTAKLHDKHFSFLLQYPYSSFHEYLKEEYSVVSKESFPDYFPTKKSFLKEVTSWLSLSPLTES